MALDAAKMGTELHGSAPIVEAGIVAGVGGGVLMGIWLMLVTAAGGMGFLAPLKLIAATFYGQNAMTGGGVVALAGLVLHVIVSLVFGVIFAVLIIRAAPAIGPSWGSAILYGAVTWALMTFVVLPVVDPLMRSTVATMPLAWFAAHILYGVGLAYTPILRRRYRLPHSAS